MYKPLVPYIWMRGYLLSLSPHECTLPPETIDNYLLIIEPMAQIKQDIDGAISPMGPC